jgi:hypothetical protein
VRAARVVGSVGQCSGFGGAFLPVKARDEAKWKRIDVAFARGEVPPRLSLYEVGDAYFGWTATTASRWIATTKSR